MGRAKTKRNDALNQYVEATEICIRTKTSNGADAFLRTSLFLLVSVLLHCRALKKEEEGAGNGVDGEGWGEGGGGGEIARRRRNKEGGEN